MFSNDDISCRRYLVLSFRSLTFRAISEGSPRSMPKTRFAVLTISVKEGNMPDGVCSARLWYKARRISPRATLLGLQMNCGAGAFSGRVKRSGWSRRFSFRRRYFSILEIDFLMAILTEPFFSCKRRHSDLRAGCQRHCTH